MLRGGELIKGMTDTVLSHVEERCEADQGKASTELKQIKETNGNRKEKQSNDKGEKLSQQSAVCVRQEHGARVRGSDEHPLLWMQEPSSHACTYAVSRLMPPPHCYGQSQQLNQSRSSIDWHNI